jgi:alkylhydroperoxidase family enzyme
MPRNLKELDWSSPILPSVEDPEWEVTVRKHMGMVPDIMTRVSASGWLREMTMKSLKVPARVIPRHLADISTLVCAQENACRFCYGVARSQMKLFGYSNRMISNIEQDMMMAELDHKDRVFIKFCRNLARSNPRPPKNERDKLLKLGFTQVQVTEMAFHVARECFVNRVVTFISSPPMYDFERLSDSLLAKLFRPIIARKVRAGGYTGNGDFKVNEGPFTHVMQSLAEIPAAVVFQDGLEGAFASDVLSLELRILMFSVVARSLGCSFCSDATSKKALEFGFSEEEFINALSTLTSPRLNDQEQLLLAWTRDTVHYQTGPMQKKMKELSEVIDNDKLLEAIGVAALANSIVRLAVLLE